MPEFAEEAAGGTASAWIVLVFMVAMLGVLALEAETRIGMVASVVWMLIIVAAAKWNVRRLTTSSTR